MSDKIVLQKYYGDVIQVDGKCWQFAGVDDAPLTHTSGDVSALFASCEDCLGGIDPIDPPSGFSQSMGDCHYIYGNPSTIAVDPTSASLNVDDNSSDNEIVWWTHTEGGVEYVIKYSQQTFAFTVDGRSIDQVVVSASDGSVNDTYTLTNPQSATLRNGGAWVNTGVSGLGTAMSYNVTERIIPPSACCSILGDYFALFNLSVQPTSGFSNVDEYGGALWYIWKKAETFASTPINTASSAGMDGIGLFLSGLDGYTSRSQFETTPSSVREVYNATDVTAIFDRLKELSTIDGYWNADWDPLAQDPIDCPISDCGTPNADPSIIMTLSWTDADVTKSWLGCTWCNGETKQLYSTAYQLSPFNGTDAFETWRRNVNTTNNFRMNRFYANTAVTSIAGTVKLGINGPDNLHQHGFDVYTFFTTTTGVDFGILVVGDVGQSSMDYRLLDKQAGTNSYTDVSGVKYQWSRGTGW